MLSKLRNVLDIKTLKSVYYAIFKSHLCYASLVWVQNTTLFKILHLLWKRSVRIMFFRRRTSYDNTALANCIFFSKCLKGLLGSIFNNWFKFSIKSSPHDTRWSNLVISKYTLTVLKRKMHFHCL